MTTLPSHSRWGCFLDDQDANKNSTSNADDEAVYNADSEEMYNADSEVLLSNKFYRQQESYAKR